MGSGTLTRTHTHTLSEATGFDRALIMAGLELLAEDAPRATDLPETATPVSLEGYDSDEILERCALLIDAVRHGNVEIPALGEAEGE